MAAGQSREGAGDPGFTLSKARRDLGARPSLWFSVSAIGPPTLESPGSRFKSRVAGPLRQRIFQSVGNDRSLESVFFKHATQALLMGNQVWKMLV